MFPDAAERPIHLHTTYLYGFPTKPTEVILSLLTGSIWSPDRRKPKEEEKNAVYLHHAVLRFAGGLRCIYCYRTLHQTAM